MGDEDGKLWTRCVDFHGHACGGLAVGYQATSLPWNCWMSITEPPMRSLCASRKNDACGVDAVQALLGCTVGKGNLLIRLRGKRAFSFYNRKSGASVRLVLRDTPGKARDERKDWLMHGDYHEMFDVKEAVVGCPRPRKIFTSYTCAKCGERVAESHIRVQNGEMVCEDCYPAYSRIL
jgi:formylmethanofuran dehydrogenase subunit E